MSAIIQRVKETFSQEERLKKRAKRALDIADRIIVEMRAQQINIKKCSQYQKSMLDNLHKVMDGALKLGNKPLYMQAGKLAEVVGNWHAVTKQMIDDEGVMMQFVALIKSFYIALIEYKEIVKDFSKTTRDFVDLSSPLKQFGLSVPKQIQITSSEAAASFREFVNSLSTIGMTYTGLTDYVIIDEEDKWSKRFDEERQRLIQKQHGAENRK